MNMEDSRPDWYWEMIVRSDAEQEELISCYLFEAGAAGIETISREDGRQVLKLYFGADITDPQAMVRALVPRALIDSGALQIGEPMKKAVQNWQDNWKSHFKPLAVGDRFLIRPPWEPSQPGKLEIVIHPGQGFGTGYHESTHLALQLLEWLEQRHPLKTVLDLGTGSGILAIAALRLQAEKVVALDIEPSSLAEVWQNVRLSGIEAPPLQVDIGAIEAYEGAGGDLVMANIEDRILIRLIDRLLALTRLGGVLLLSGILSARRGLLLERLQIDMEIIQERVAGDWYAVALQRR